MSRNASPRRAHADHRARGNTRAEAHEARAVPLRATSQVAPIAVTFCLIFGALALWSLATPLFAAPDEPAHLIKAVAVVHGDWIGATTAASDPDSTVAVPLLYQSALGVPGCFVHDPQLTPACSPPLSRSTTMTSVAIQVGRYPPLYYLVAGIPSLFATSRASVYATRLVSAGTSALFLTLAVASVLLWSRRRTLLAGLLLSLTPQVLFLGSVINPSGLEISAALCLWASGSILLFERAGSPPPGLVTIVATSACTEMLVRGLSPLWVALTFLILVLFAGLGALRSVLSGRAGVAGLAALGLSALGAALWLVFAHGLDVQKAHATPRSMTVPARLFGILERQGWWLRQSIGEFDWEDTPAPLSCYLIWSVMSFVVAAIVLVRSRLGDRVKLLVSIAIGVMVPVAIVLSQYSKLNGIVWQGKDGAPLVLGLPILVVAVLGRSRPRTADRWAWRTVVAAVAIGQIVAFALVLSRFTNGTGAPFEFFAGALWSPPGGAPLLVALMTVIVALGAAGAWLAMRDRGEELAGAAFGGTEGVR